MASDQEIQRLIKELGDKDSNVRWRAVEALGKIGDKRAVVPLIEKLGDEGSGVRYYAVEALGKIGDKRAVVPLIERLGDDDPEVRYRAVVALGKIRSEKAADGLIEVLENIDPGMIYCTAESLGKLGEKGIEIDLKKVRNVLTNLTDKKEATKIYQKINDIIRKGKERNNGKLSEGKPKKSANAKCRLVRIRRIRHG